MTDPMAATIFKIYQLSFSVLFGSLVTNPKSEFLNSTADPKIKRN